MKKPNKKAPPKKATPSQAKLAAVLGVTRQLLACHVHKPGAPKLDDVAGWSEFLAQHGRTGSLPADLRRAIGDERLGILRETRRRLQRENDAAAGRIIDADEVRRDAERVMNMIFGELDRIFLNELPPSICGLDAPAVAARCKAEIKRFRLKIHEGFEMLKTETPQPHEKETSTTQTP